LQGGQAVTSQEKKQYLERYNILNKEINRALEECEEWRARAQKITPSFSFAPKSQSQESRLVIAVEHIIELEEKMNADIDELIKARKNIESSINALPEPLRILMKYKYIDGLTLRQISIKLGKNRDQINYLHGKALKTISCI
jgi:DNA-directed RNA polymerase specialized sigma24 family protein